MEEKNKQFDWNYNDKLKPLAQNLRRDMTKAEACLWKYVLRAGRMKGFTFNRQKTVLNYIADFMCKELKLIIEVDGLTHADPDVFAKDIERQRVLEDAGFTVVRFTDKDVLENIAGVHMAISNCIDTLNSP